ncbi:MAG: hypothetical protein ACI9FJ_003143 [Alteromonadaceae bacterium]|jgi:uncharacterized protein YeaC (DUF1315 family)
MNINELVKNITPAVYENLRVAVETGKWPDGNRLTQAQKDNTLQLVMAYQSKVLKSQEHFTVGEDGHIVNRKKDELKNQFKPGSQSKHQSVTSAEAQPGIARFTHDDI